MFWKPAKDDEPRPEGSVEGGGFTVTPDMMSLVGCSGEEFSAILRAVGFRSEVRKRAAKPAAAATEAAGETPDGGGAAEDSATPAPVQATGQHAPETQRVEAQPKETPADAEHSEPAEASPAAAAEGEPAETAAPAAEPDQVEVWKPKPAKRRDHGGKNRSAAPRGRKRGKSSSEKPPQAQKRNHGSKTPREQTGPAA